MNENIDLTKILKDCPKGWKLYSPMCGEVVFSFIKENDICPIILCYEGGQITFSKEGFYYKSYKDAECLLFPSKDQRDWSKFSAPWYKNEKFDPKTLQPFDKVIAKDLIYYTWRCDLFSDIIESSNFPYRCVTASYQCCIPYNDDTKHLLGTKDEAPEYYRYWED